MRFATRRDLGWLVAALASLAAFGVGARVVGLRWQHTASLPRGLYTLDRHGRVERGTIVLWCLDSTRGRWARDRGYVTRGDCPGSVEPLGKVILAIAGDTIDWSAAGVALNGRAIPNTGVLRLDGRRRPLSPIAFARRVIGRDSLWVYSPYTDRSLDSRYFGPVPTSSVLGVLKAW